MFLKTEDQNNTIVRNLHDLPEELSAEELATFLYESLKPYEDSLRDIRAALDRVLQTESTLGGFILLATNGKMLRGVLVILYTPWSGYVPENLLLYVAVAPQHRGRGLGRRLITQALENCKGDVKLHVEHSNPAICLYERIGFSSKYAEMRLSR